MFKNVAILCKENADGGLAQALAKKLSMELLDNPDDQRFAFYLVPSKQRLELHVAANKNMAPFYIDFLHGAIQYRCHQGGGRRQPLARAIGLQPGYSPTVLDVTAGLGRDSWILANLGCSVTMLERSPIVAALLEDGLHRALVQQPLPIRLMVTEACEYLSALSQPADYPDVIYMDPMFPTKPKVALVKKDMQILQQLVNDVDNAVEVFTLALQTAKKRVVVKRPQWAKPISDIQPSGVVATKRHRFEIYSATTTAK